MDWLEKWYGVHCPKVNVKCGIGAEIIFCEVRFLYQPIKMWVVDLRVRKKCGFGEINILI
jgi:hypothetical protein